MPQRSAPSTLTGVAIVGDADVRVRNAVVKGWITAEEFLAITGGFYGGGN